MTTWVVLLRGVNVGGARKLPMASLRALLEGLGLRDVRTYVQSGNAVFRSTSADGPALAEDIRRSVSQRVGSDVPVVILRGEDLDRVIASNPFPEVLDPKRLHVAFCAGMPDPSALAGLDADAFLPERWSMGAREVFLHLPDGIGTAKLTHAFLEKKLKVPCTARNWRTVCALRDLATSTP